MKQKSFIIALMLLVNIIQGQPLSGIKTIPGDYGSIQSAISALNTNGVSAGGVTFNIAAGYSETFGSPTAGLIYYFETPTATGTWDYRTIVRNGSCNTEQSTKTSVEIGRAHV